LLNKSLEYIFPNPPAGLDPKALDPAREPQHVAVHGQRSRAGHIFMR
jgi:hypothetical protein